MAKTMTPKEIAAQFGTDPRTLRKFLRTDARDRGAETPGKGSRWEIEARSVRSLRKRFDVWNAARTATPDEPDATTDDA